MKYSILGQSKTINMIVKWIYLGLMFLMLFPVAIKTTAIDKEHLKRFPNCGKMPQMSSSRIINSKEAKVHYPWVVQVRRYWKGNKIRVCGGTIITKR